MVQAFRLGEERKSLRGNSGCQQAAQESEREGLDGLHA